MSSSPVGSRGSYTRGPTPTKVMTIQEGGHAERARGALSSRSGKPSGESSVLARDAQRPDDERGPRKQWILFMSLGRYDGSPRE